MSFLTLCHGEKQNYQKQLILDCANGVGSVVMREFLGLAGVKKRLNITMINNDKEPKHLNEGCGAEHVHSKQTLPNGWNAATHQNMKCVSFDGDADRQIYYYGDAGGNYHGANGDKQFALIMMYIRNLLQKAGIVDKVTHILV